MTMSNRPRVLTEQDAGTMDTLIRRGEQAATVAEQKAQQLQDAAADLEQVKGTIPAAAQSAAALATAQAKATLDAATLNATTAATQATLALATLPKFRSPDTSNPPAPTQAELDANPNGLGGTRLTADGATQPLRWTPHTLAGAWVTMGAPTATAPQVQEARDLAQQADGRAVDAQALAEQADSKADSASNQIVDTRATLTCTRAQLASGTLVMPADASRIWDEFTSLAVRAVAPGETPNLVTTFALSGGRIAEREGVADLRPRWAGAAADGTTVDDAAWQRCLNLSPLLKLPVLGENLTYVLKRTLVNSNTYIDDALILADVTGGGTDLCSPFTLNGRYVGPGPYTKAKFESARISNVRFGPNLRIDGRRGLMTGVASSGLEDGGRACIALYGRASNITFQGSYDNAATDGVFLYSDYTRSSELSGAERDPYDACFVNIVWDGAKARGNRRHGGSSDSVSVIQFVGDYDLSGNGLDLPGVTAQTPETSGLRGSLYFGSLYGCGWDFESYDLGGAHRGIYMAASGRAIANAGAALLFWIPSTEYNAAEHKPWDDITVLCRCEAGPFSSGNGAINFNLPAGLGNAAKPIATNVNLRPRKLIGRINAQFLSGKISADFAAPLVEGDVYWCNATGSSGVLTQPPNTTTLRPYVESGNLRLDGILPNLSALPTLIRADGDPVTLTAQSAAVTSREDGVYRLSLIYDVTPLSGYSRTVLRVVAASQGEQIVALSAGAIDNGNGVTRAGIQYGPVNEFALSWQGSGALHILAVQVVMRVRYGAST